MHTINTREFAEGIQCCIVKDLLNNNVININVDVCYVDVFKLTLYTN